MKFLIALLLAFLALLGSSQPVKPKNGAEISVLKKSKIIEWPFFLDDDDYLLSVNIGTPAQQVNVSMYYFYDTLDLRIKQKLYGGDYNNSASSSFVYSGENAYDSQGNDIGLLGLEDFTVGEVSLKEMPFTATNTDPLAFYDNYIGLGRPDKGTFLEAVLQPYEDKAITYAFSTFPTSGILTIGGLDSERCYKNWKLVNESFWGDDKEKWGVAIDSFSAGNYVASNPGYVMFTIYDQSLIWPKTVYYPLIKALGSNDGESVPCNTTVNIVFELEDLTFELTPDHYLDRDMEKTKGICLLAGKTVGTSDEYILPRSILKDYCLSVNHYKRKVALATRKE